jgi:hypothetical protein
MVWGLKRDSYQWVGARLLSNKLPNMSRHDLIWIQPSKASEQNQLVCRGILLEPPLEHGMAIMLGRCLVARLVRSSLRCNEIEWENAPLKPLGREFHQLEIAVEFHLSCLTPELSRYAKCVRLE